LSDRRGEHVDRCPTGAGASEGNGDPVGSGASLRCRRAKDEGHLGGVEDVIGDQIEHLRFREPGRCPAALTRTTLGTAAGPGARGSVSRFAS